MLPHLFKSFFVIFLLIITVPDQSYAKSIKFVTSSVAFNRIYQLDHRYEINNGSLDMTMQVAQDYTRDVWGLIDICLQNRKTKEYRTVLRYEFNSCQMMRKMGGNILSNIMQAVIKNGNVAKSCPILKGNYSFHVSPDSFTIPSFARNGPYRFQMNTSFHETRKYPMRASIANITVHFAIQ